MAVSVCPLARLQRGCSANLARNFFGGEAEPTPTPELGLAAPNSSVLELFSLYLHYHKHHHHTVLMKARFAARQWSQQLHSCHSQLLRNNASAVRYFGTSPSTRTEQEQIRAAPPIDFDSPVDNGRKFARIVPESPSYFTAAPQFTDSLLTLQQLLRKYQTLPALSPSAAPRAVWEKLKDYRQRVAEPVKESKYNRVVSLLKRLNQIHPTLMPEEVSEALAQHRSPFDADANKGTPEVVDEFGRAKGVGRRKESSARVLLVEGTGEVLINGRSINAAFGRIHDRESAMWPLKVTGRLDKYNVWALATGGGTTGQAEAITLGLAKALLVHEPALKPILRRAGVLTRDRRRVERKKPGHVKARKMPTWVKR